MNAIYGTVVSHTPRTPSTVVWLTPHERHLRYRQSGSLPMNGLYSHDVGLTPQAATVPSSGSLPMNAIYATSTVPSSGSLPMNAIYGTVVCLTPHERHLRPSRRNGLYSHDGVTGRYPCSSNVTAFLWDRRCLRIQVVVDVVRSNQPTLLPPSLPHSLPP